MKLFRVITILIFLFPFNGWSQMYVSPSGSDLFEGTKTKPLASVAMAFRKAREMRRLRDPSIKNGIEIIVENGRYQFSEPLFIRPEDAGTETSPTIIKAADGAHPVFSGGFEINNWKKLRSAIPGLSNKSIEGIWVTDVPQTETGAASFRQLWVNGIKAIRAKDKSGDSMHRILSWDHVSQTCWIPKLPGTDISKARGMEMFIHQWWAIAILRIKKIKIAGDSIQLSFYQPESRIQSEHPWPPPWISKQTGNSAFYLANAIQFLDEPGEWYLDERAGKIYYYPRANENMSSATVIAPFLETMVKIEGTIDNPVSNIFFKGISFQHSGWLRPSLLGHVPLQAGMYMIDAYKLQIPGTPDKKGLENQAWIGRPSAAVEVSYAHHISFEDCRFEHLAATALDFKKGTHDDDINANLFKDIGGTAIQVGTFSDEAFETHLPYNPKDEREICTNENISNNFITDATNEDWGTVGIAAGFVRGINISHNDISHVSYTGISVGWGWTKSANAMRDNRIHANKIHHYAKHMYDVAGIYTLSAQPSTIISDNYIDSIYKAPYAHDPDHWFYLYTDEGSSYITVKNNWCPSEKFLQNANGPGNHWENNGPKVSDTVKQHAGLEPSYRYLLANKPFSLFGTEKIPTNPYAANQKPLVIEVTGVDTDPDRNSLVEVFKKNGISSNEIYQWKDHVVSFAPVKDTAGLRNQILSKFPGKQLKIYHEMFYVFDRNKCDDKTISKEWDHILLTANMVNDKKLQKEYLDYHAAQYKQWPDVSKGFCHAGFQQLLLFRNGRQLMLVISIPKGKSLDELNPKTTENNPKMNEWNEIMKKYQEGIQGTKKGETWVFLKPVTQK